MNSRVHLFLNDQLRSLSLKCPHKLSDRLVKQLPNRLDLGRKQLPLLCEDAHYNAPSHLRKQFLYSLLFDHQLTLPRQQPLRNAMHQDVMSHPTLTVLRAYTSYVYLPPPTN